MNTLKKLAPLALSLPLAVFGYGGTWTQGDVTLSYTLSGDEACVSIAACGESAEVVIPSEIVDGDVYKVTSIGQTSSDCRAKLASVVIPDSVMSIGNSAFSGCTNLKSVTIPNSVTSIGQFAFAGCRGLKSVTIPDGVTSIGGWAFQGCSGLESVTIPDSVTSIERCAFNGCIVLTSVTIPNSVTSIVAYAFQDCHSLKSVTIPNSVTSIGGSAFYGCSGLTSVTIPSSVESIDDWAFSNCDGLTTVFVDLGGVERVKELLQSSNVGVNVDQLSFVEVETVSPFVEGDDGATVTGDAESGWTVTPSDGTEAVVVTIPDGVDAAKVTVKVSPETKKVTPNGAAVKVVRGDADITDYLDIPAADASGVIDLTAVTVKEEIAKAVLSVADGAEIDLSAENPVLTTAETKPGLKYQLYEGATLSDLKAGDSTVGDGSPWTPKITEKGGTSGFYTIQVTK